MVIDNNFIWNRNVYTFPSFCPNHPNLVDRIAVTNNHFEYLTTTAIDATAVLNLTVSGNLIRNTSRGIEQYVAVNEPPRAEDDGPGIRIANCARRSVPAAIR